MKAIFHYGYFKGEIDIKEPKYDMWLVEPQGYADIAPHDIQENEATLDVNYEPINKLHFVLMSPPRLGEPVEYKFVGKG